MANCYTKAAFVLTVAGAEAELLERARSAADLLGSGEPEGEARRAAFDSLGGAFAAAFPPGIDDPFASFCTLFDDPDYTSLDCDISPGTPDEAGRVSVCFGGEQVSPGTLAELIRRACPSALPCGFEFAFDCDRLRPGEFGGGYVVITAEEVSVYGSRDGLDRALARAADEGADRFVLVTRDPNHGLSFWNNEAGFERLMDATVFTEAEASQFDTSVTGDEPEWLALPPLA